MCIFLEIFYHICERYIYQPFEMSGRKSCDISTSQTSYFAKTVRLLLLWVQVWVLEIGVSRTSSLTGMKSIYRFVANHYWDANKLQECNKKLPLACYPSTRFWVKLQNKWVASFLNRYISNWLNISLLKSFLLMISVFYWYRSKLTILNM